MDIQTSSTTLPNHIDFHTQICTHNIYLLVASSTATVHSTVIISPFGLVSCTIFWISLKCSSNWPTAPWPTNAAVRPNPLPPATGLLVAVLGAVVVLALAIVDARV